MKRIFTVLIAFLLLVSFNSCQKEAGHLDLSLYDEAFRNQNRILFLNDRCDHAIVYTPASECSITADANLYHTKKCKWGNCTFEKELEPHTICISKLSFTTEMTKYMENGYFYHRSVNSCAMCGERVVLYIYCLSQDKDCHKNQSDNPCYQRDWEKILCDTPYEISYD